MNKKLSKYHFGAGPSLLPLSVLEETQRDILNWQDSGISILEVSHRAQKFEGLFKELEHYVRTMLHIPHSYHVLFLPGVTRTQFSMIPTNFLGASEQAAYIVTGLWSQMAYQEAARLKNAYILASTEAEGFTTIPNANLFDIRPNTKYIYFTPNETIHGVRYIPDLRYFQLPVIADMTSFLFMEPIDIENYALVFAGSQKLLGTPGLTLVIVRDDFIENIQESNLPITFNYKTYAKSPMYATPPTFQCYLAHQMLQFYMQRSGGMRGWYEESMQKAEEMYQYLDNSAVFRPRIQGGERSRINICFDAVNTELGGTFLRDAEGRGLSGLQGHRLLGGLRASLYHAMPMEGVHALIEAMKEFEKAIASQ